MLPSFVKEPLVSFSYNYRPLSGISWDKVTRKEREWWSRFNLHLHERSRGKWGGAHVSHSRRMGDTTNITYHVGYLKYLEIFHIITNSFLKLYQ
jgi:hypothetical protein